MNHCLVLFLGSQKVGVYKVISLYPQITLPTRFTRTNGTLIDNFFCILNKTILESKTGILTNKLSDHQPYFMSLKITQKNEPLPKYIKINIVNTEAMHNVRHEIKSEEIYNKFNKKPTADPNSNFTTLCNEILRSKNKHMPSKWVKFNKYKHKKSSWITQGLLKSIKFRDNLYKRLKLTNPNSTNYNTININLKTYNGILKRSIRTAKHTYFELCFNRFKNDIRNTWKTINDILSKTKLQTKSKTVIVENGVTHKDKEIIANKFNHFFTNIAQTLAREIKYDGNKNYKYYLNKRIDTVFTFQNIDEETVRKTIQNLPSKNSCGLDGISSKLIKIIEPAIIKPLTLLINQVFNTGIFPDELKIAKVIPLFKKDDPTLLKNYRPISLLSTIAKVMEKIIFTQLSSYFNEHKLIFDNQYGFRPKHSTEYAALELVDRIITQMDKKETPINIFLDLSKAFDTIDHTILLAKLRYYGIHDTALLLLKSYLNNRKQYVEFEDTKSEILPITVGVPQGSILGPLLFIIYINDFSQASSVFKFIMYADDTTLFSNLKSFGNNIQTREYLINAELSNVREWLDINKLSLNKSKSKYMIFHVPNKDIQYLTLKIDNVIIEKVDEFSFLGLTMDTNLNWKRHSEKICNKCAKMIGILNRLKYVLPHGIKIMLYNSLILPHINYCIMAWGYKGSRLLKIQKKAARIITLSGYSTHSEPLFKQLNMLKIADQLRLQELKFYFKYIHKNLPAYLLDWEFISNANIHIHDTRTSSKIHTARSNHEFAKKCLKYNLPHIINDTPEIVVEKIYTHSLRGFTTYAKQFLIQKYTDTCAIPNCYSCNQYHH